MRCLARCLLLACLLVPGGLFTNQAEGSEPVAAAMDRVLANVIRPGYRALREDSLTMRENVSRLCEQAGDADLAIAREQFRELVATWGRIEMVRFGPILGNNLLERMFFFPDRRGSGLKRVQKLLALEEEKALRADGLAQISVAAQGLSAMEFVLFGTGSQTLADTPDTYRCRYGETVAGNIHTIAVQLDDDWNSEKPFLGMWREPGPYNPAFNGDDAALTHLLSTIVHGLEEVRTVRLAAFLKKEPIKDRPKSAPLWRSNSTMPLLLANIASVERIFLISDLGSFVPSDHRLVVDSAEALFKTLSEGRASDASIAEQLSDEDARKLLVRLDEVLGVLIVTLDRDLAAALGLSVGFFFADGD